MTHTRKCKGCGREISAYSARCMYCGMARPVRCSKCGKLTRDGSTMCAHCGHALLDPQRIPEKMKTPPPPYEWKPGSNSTPPPADPPAQSIETWKAVLIVGSSLFVVLFVLQTVLVSRQRARKSQTTKEIHALWDAAKELSAQGDMTGARAACTDALAKMRECALKDPALRAAIGRELQTLAPEKPKPPDKVVQRKTMREGLAAEGFICHDALAHQAKPPGRGFYLQRLCVEVWTKVVNISDKPVKVSRRSFAILLDDGRSLAPDDVYEAYHLPEKEIQPGGSLSGAVLFGSREEKTIDPQHVKEVTYAGKPIWTRPTDVSNP